MPVHRRASDVNSRAPLGFAGLNSLDPRNVVHDFVNLDGSTEKQIAITVGGTVAGTDDFGIALSGRTPGLADYTFLFSSTAGASSATLAAAEIAEAFNMDASATQFAWASANGAVVTLVSPRQGSEFDFSAASTAAGTPTLTPATAQAAGDPGPIPFGRVILRGTLSGTNYLTGVDYVDNPGQVLGKPCTVANTPSDIEEEAFGINLYRPSEQDTRTIGTSATAVAAGEEGAALETGKILVEWDGAQPSYDDTVYVGFAVGEEGRLYNSAGTSRVVWARAKFLGQGRDNLTYVWLRAS